MRRTGTDDYRDDEDRVASHEMAALVFESLDRQEDAERARQAARRLREDRPADVA